MKYLYHIAKSADWANAQKTGEYTVGSLQRSYEEDGFIHLSYAAQVNVIADLIYKDTPSLLLLSIDPSRLTAKVKDEKAEYPAEFFPHLYGPLNTDAVVSALPYQMANGKFPVVDTE